jgi:hypothetical protein
MLDNVGKPGRLEFGQGMISGGNYNAFHHKRQPNLTGLKNRNLPLLDFQQHFTMPPPQHA